MFASCVHLSWWLNMVISTVNQILSRTSWMLDDMWYLYARQLILSWHTSSIILRCTLLQLVYILKSVDVSGWQRVHVILSDGISPNRYRPEDTRCKVGDVSAETSHVRFQPEQQWTQEMLLCYIIIMRQLFITYSGFGCTFVHFTVIFLLKRYVC